MLPFARVHYVRKQGNRNAVVHHSPGLADRREAYPGNHTSEHRRSSPIASIERQSAQTAINPRSVPRTLFSLSTPSDMECWAVSEAR
jgi:hypothetical protein